MSAATRRSNVNASSVPKRGSKIYPVQLSKMRTPPALVTQRPFRKAHGDAIANNLDLDKLGIPIMNHRDGIFWILDGQHRVYGLIQNNFDTYSIDCEVYEGLSDQEMADIFLGRDDRKAVDAYSKFHIACTAGHKRENDIRRIVETQGLKISKNRGVDCVGAISALARVYDRSGEVILGKTLRAIKNAYPGDPYAFDANVIDGIGLVFSRYANQVIERDLAERLSKAPYGVNGLMKRAETLRMRVGNQKAACVAAVAVEIYNKARSGVKLASWWKAGDQGEE